MDNTVSVREVRENLADVVERATRDELTIITKRGREVAAVVPIEMVREYREWEEERVLRTINERRTAAQPGIPMDQVMDEILESDGWSTGPSSIRRQGWKSGACPAGPQ